MPAHTMPSYTEFATKAFFSPFSFAYCNRIYYKRDREKEKNMNHLKTFRQFIKEEDGMGTVEVILIIVVLVGLVVIFKEKITEIVNSIFSKITSQTKKI